MPRIRNAVSTFILSSFPTQWHKHWWVWQSLAWPIPKAKIQASRNHRSRFVKKFPETLRKQRESQRDESSNSTSTHSHPESQWCPSKKHSGGEVLWVGETGCHSITRATEQRWGKEKRPTSLPGSRDVWRDTSLRSSSKAAGYMYLKKTIHEVLTLRPGYHIETPKKTGISSLKPHKKNWGRRAFLTDGNCNPKCFGTWILRYQRYMIMKQ